MRSDYNVAETYQGLRLVEFGRGRSTQKSQRFCVERSLKAAPFFATLKMSLEKSDLLGDLFLLKSMNHIE